MVVAHELAHMWFGDLVTMAWWEGLWLNEAFATYMQYVCVDAYRPAWQMWVRFSAERELGLTIDGLHSTRTIEFPVSAPSEAMAMADPITYQKGGSVLKMLESYLGPETFRDGIRRYLRDHAYSNTVTTDLWSALEAVSGEPVGQIMDTWILQGGHPVVEVKGLIRQSAFTFTPKTTDSAIGTTWLIPVRSREIGSTQTSRQGLAEEPQPLATAGPTLVNAGGSVSRRDYGPTELASIADSLVTSWRLGAVLVDAWALHALLAGRREVRDLLTLARGLGDEVATPAWRP